MVKQNKREAKLHNVKFMAQYEATEYIGKGL